MSSTPDPPDLQCVVTLAETLSFTETAKRLNMTQPGVSANINSQCFLAISRRAMPAAPKEWKEETAAVCAGA
jgi:Bacterial regulatory helix-turn-helix protein, lysR family